MHVTIHSRTIAFFTLTAALMAGCDEPSEGGPAPGEQGGPAALAVVEAFPAEIDHAALPADLAVLTTSASTNRHLQFRPDVAVDPAALFARHGAFGLGPADTMDLVDTIKDGDFVAHRYQQRHHGVVVEQAQMVLSSQEGRLLWANGDVAPGLAIDVKPAFSAEEAVRIAANAAGFDAPDPTAPHGDASADAAVEIVITPTTDAARRFVAAYRVELQRDSYGIDPIAVLIDIHTGEVVAMRSLLWHGCNTGGVQTLYDGARTFTTKDSWEPFWNHYRLTDECRGDEIRTRETGGGNYKDSDNQWSGAPATAHWAAQRAWDYFVASHGRNGVNGGGWRLYVYPDYGFGEPNAGWSSDNSILVGAGGPGWGNMATLDVIGHEYTHGVVYSTSKLSSPEGAALNESFADIFGAMIERTTAGASADNWTVGEDAKVLRSMKSPQSFGDPSVYKGQSWDFANEPHRNAGVQNHWFYLLSEGGSQLGVAVTGVGAVKAAAIAYRNMVTLPPTAGYADARVGAIQAAQTLYGACSDEVAATTNAWSAVGVGAQHVPCLHLSPVSGATSVCRNKMGLGTYLYTVTTSASPADIQWTVPAGWTYNLENGNKRIRITGTANASSGLVSAKATDNGFVNTTKLPVSVTDCAPPPQSPHCINECPQTPPEP